MTGEHDSKRGLSRRTVLRRGTVVAVGSTVGVGAISGTATATRICPKTPGYWMNHEWPDGALENVNEVLTRGSEDYWDPPLEGDFSGIIPPFDSVGQGQEYLRQPPRGDKGTIMAFHLIATVLNFQEHEDDCYDLKSGVADVTDSAPDKFLVDGAAGEESMVEIKRLAQNWLYQSNFPESQRSWTVTTAAVQDGEVLKDLLDEFNNDELLDCTCGNSEEDDESGGPPEGRGPSGGGPP